jgi:predicted metalloprotease with PDZ domain
VHSDREERKNGYRTVQVPAGSGGDEALPPELRVGKDEKLHRQTCTLGSEGDLKLYRSVEKEVAYLGATLAPLDAEHAKGVGADPFGGVLVSSVDADGPALRAGVKKDDIITALAGKPVVTPEQVEYLVEQSAPWTPIPLRLLRQGETSAVTVELGTETRIVSSRMLEKKLPLIDDLRRTGLKLVEVPDDIRPLILGPDAKERGLVVVDVLAGGPAFRQGLKFRDQVLRVGGQPVASEGEYSRALAAVPPGEDAVFSVLRDGHPVEARIQVASDATATSAFSILGLVKNESAPARSEFSLLWGLLFEAEANHSIKSRDEQPEYRTERHWGAVLDLISFRSSPRKKEFRLLWLFPIYWQSG